MNTRHSRYIIRYILLLLPVILYLTGCDVHEFPKLPEENPLRLRLVFDTDMPQMHVIYGEEPQSPVPGVSMIQKGSVRHTVRITPTDETSGAPIQVEFVRPVENSTYDCEVPVTLPNGTYNIAVWSDVIEKADSPGYYGINDFSNITLPNPYQGNTDYRDAFRGEVKVSVEASIKESPERSVEIPMSRPMAKYEFITTDLKEFIGKEYTRMASRAENPEALSEIRIEDYSVVFYYPAFLPSAYNLHNDRAFDATTGMSFTSRMTQVSDTEASIGFDYVFANSGKAAVNVRIGIYDSEGTCIALTETIDVPLLRSIHTLMHGRFLMTKTQGSVNIDPSYDDEWNIWLH